MNSLIFIELKKIKSYFNNYFINMNFIILGLIIQLSVYLIFIQEKGELYQQTLIYIIISNAIYRSTAFSRIPKFAESIQTGEVIKYFLKPFSFFEYIFYEEIGISIASTIQVIPLFLLGIVLKIYFYRGWIDIIYFLFSLILGQIISIMLSNIFYSFSFITSKYGGAKALFQGVSAILSGALIPITLWPSNLLKIVKYQPFFSVVNTPIQLLLRNINPIKGLLVQLIWLVIVALLSKVIVEKSSQQIEFFGG